AMSMEHGSGDSYRYFYESMLSHVVHWAQTTHRNGHAIIEESQARLRLALATVRHEVAKVLCGRAVWAAQFNIPNRSFFGPMSKVFSVESYVQSSIELADLAAPFSLFEGDQGAGHIEIGFRQSIGTTIYG